MSRNGTMQGLFREPEHKLLAATCREKNVPVALVQQLIELELSDKRHGCGSASPTVMTHS